MRRLIFLVVVFLVTIELAVRFWHLERLRCTFMRCSRVDTIMRWMLWLLLVLFIPALALFCAR